MRSLLFAHRSWDSELDAQFLHSTHTYLLRHILIIEFSYLLDHTYCRMGWLIFFLKLLWWDFFPLVSQHVHYLYVRKPLLRQGVLFYRPGWPLNHKISICLPSAEICLPFVLFCLFKWYVTDWIQIILFTCIWRCWTGTSTMCWRLYARRKLTPFSS